MRGTCEACKIKCTRDASFECTHSSAYATRRFRLSSLRMSLFSYTPHTHAHTRRNTRGNCICHLRHGVWLHLVIQMRISVNYVCVGETARFLVVATKCARLAGAYKRRQVTGCRSHKILRITIPPPPPRWALKPIRAARFCGHPYLKGLVKATHTHTDSTAHLPLARVLQQRALRFILAVHLFDQMFGGSQCAALSTSRSVRTQINARACT